MTEQEIKELPANIYKMYLEYLNENTYYRKATLMLEVFKQIVQFFGCIFLSEYLWDEEKKDELVNARIRQMFRPSLGNWYGLVETYSDSFCIVNESWLEGFFDCFYETSQKKTDIKQKYTERFRNKKADAASAYNELIQLRNEIAHGAQPPSEEESKKILEAYSSCLEQILSDFLPIFKRYKVAKCVEAKTIDIETRTRKWIAWFDIINYETVENERYRLDWPYDTTELGKHPESFFQYGSNAGDDHKSFYLLDMEKPERILKFSEILVEIMDDDLHEDYLVYDGYGNTNVTYVGVKEKRRLKEYLEAIRSRFTSRGCNLHWSHHDFTMEGFRSYVNELSQISINIHADNKKYNNSLYISRACDSEMETFLASDKTTLFVSAEAGAGKTCFLCHTAETLFMERERYAVYFYNAGHLGQFGDGTNVLFKKLEEECLENNDFKSSEEFLSYIDINNPEGIRFVLIVDAANEAFNALNILREIDEITTQCGQYPWLKIIISIRSISFEHLKSKARSFSFPTSPKRFYSIMRDGHMSYELEIERWNPIQVIEAYNKYKEKNEDRLNIPDFETLDSEMQSVLSSPLNMHLFFELSSNVVLSGIRSDKDLFAALDEELLRNDTANNMNDLLDRIISCMIQDHKNEIDADRIVDISDALMEKYSKIQSVICLSPFEALLDAGIIYERDIAVDKQSFRVVSFVYQKYLEYRIGRSIDIKQPIESFVDAFIESMDWDELPEAFMAYASTLDRINDFRLVLETIFKKLRETHMSSDTFKHVLIPFGIGIIMKKEESDKETVVRELIDVFAENGIIDWGVRIVEELHRKAQTSLAYKAADIILENDNVDEEIRRDLYFHKAMVHQNRSEYSETVKLLEAAGKGETDKERINRVRVQLAKTKRKNKEVDKAEEILDGLLKTGTEETPYYSEALIQRGLCQVEKGLYDVALKDYEDALDITKKQRDYHTQAYDLLGISTIHDYQGNPDKAREALMKIFEITSRYGYLDLLSDCLHALALLCLKDGQYKDAKTYTDQAITLWECSGHYEGLSIMYLVKAILLIQLEEDPDKNEIEKSIARAEELHKFVNNDAVEREYKKYYDLYIASV